MDSNNLKTIHDLPNEILMEILSYVSSQNNVFLVCKSFHDAYHIVNNNTLVLFRNEQVM